MKRERACNNLTNYNMKTFNKFLLVLIIPMFFVSCDPDSGLQPNITLDCIADVAVVGLDAPAAVMSGNPIRIVCTIRNIVSTALSSCTTSEQGTLTVTCGYSPTYKSNFSDYEVIDEDTYVLDSFDANRGQVDDMDMNTNRGPGYYAMKVEVDSPNDTDGSNDAMAVAINAN